MKTKRIRKDLVAFLNGNIKYSWKEKGIFDRPAGPATTDELLTFYNDISRHGSTTHQLGNVLSKDKDIVKVGLVKSIGFLGGSYDICEWATVDWVLRHLPEENSNEIIYEHPNGFITRYIVPRDSLNRIQGLEALIV
jgi:hypothetical protein